ncbi:hypothetical protein MHYP_G00346800 [Metynnis hypsauchen]
MFRVCPVEGSVGVQYLDISLVAPASQLIDGIRAGIGFIGWNVTIRDDFRQGSQSYPRRAGVHMTLPVQSAGLRLLTAGPRSD